MIQVTRILLLIFLIFLNVEFLSAHQNHNRKDEAVSNSGSDISLSSNDIEQSKSITNCNSGDILFTECCCCINGICFKFENENDCSSNKKMNNVSCKKHCEDGKTENNNLINQNVNSQNLYKTFFKINFPNTNNINSNRLHIHQKAIKQNTPTYISIQSFLI